MESQVGVVPDTELENPASTVAIDSFSRSTVGAPREIEPEGTAFARAFWGGRWPEIAGKLQAQGKSVTWESAPTVTWEAASAVFGEQLFPLGEEQRAELVSGNLLQWEGKADAKWFREVLGVNTTISAELSSQANAIVERHNVSIAPLAEEWAERLDFEIRSAWRGGKFEHGPFALPRAEPGSFIWTSAQGYKGWTARMALTFEDCPGLKDLLSQIRSLVEARNNEVLALVLSNQ